MTKREYLRSLGFQVGERGRLNAAMLKALEGYKEEKEEVVQVAKPEPVLFHPKSEKQREPRTLYGFSREGAKVAFVLCFRCSQHMMYCTCKNGIQAPSSVITTKEPDVYIKTV